MLKNSKILIVSNIDATVQELKKTLPIHDTRIIQNEEEGKTDFLLTHAQKAIKEAYLASSNTKYIILCGTVLRIEAQNALLKVLEEPPKNIIFIIVTQSKSSILPTIFSRISHEIKQTKIQIEEFPLDLKGLELKDINIFLKENQRISKNEAKEIIESILYKVNQQNIKLNQKQLDTFSTAIKLLNLNSRPLNVLTSVLLNLISDTI